MAELADPLYDAEEMRAVDGWAIEGGRALAGADGGRGSGGGRGRCRAGRPGPRGSSAARATTAATAWWRRGTLAETGFEVEALLLWPADELSGDAKANLERLAGAREVEPASSRALRGVGVVVDAIFGTGFAGEPRDPAAGAIEAINHAERTGGRRRRRLGRQRLRTARSRAPRCAPTVTVTFHAPKLGHWIAPGKAHRRAAGGPIGIPDGGRREAAAGLIDPRCWRWRRRAAPIHQVQLGQVVVVGGSRGLTGAVCMSALGGDPQRRRLRDGRGPGGPGADLRGEADRGDVGRLRQPRGRLRRAASEQVLGRARARRPWCWAPASAARTGPGTWRATWPSGSRRRW